MHRIAQTAYRGAPVTAGLILFPLCFYAIAVRPPWQPGARLLP